MELGYKLFSDTIKQTKRDLLLMERVKMVSGKSSSLGVEETEEIMKSLKKELGDQSFHESSQDREIQVSNFDSKNQSVKIIDNEGSSPNNSFNNNNKN
jgi:hypothetical protein